MKLNHKTLIFIAGCVWLAIGIMLLTMGVRFILETLRHPLLSELEGNFSLLKFCTHFVNDRTQSAMLIVTLCLFVGYFKGKVALAKSVKKQVTRITSLPNPASIKYLYSKGYYLLIGSMIGLGMLLRICPITLDTRGAIDMVIGSALINGSMLYFRTLSHYSSLHKKDSP